MLRYLQAKFWMRVICLGLVALGFFIMPKPKRTVAQAPMVTDVIQTEEAAPVAYSPASGLTYETEQELNLYIESLNASPAAQDWKHLHQEWFSLTRQWFERIFNDAALYERYVQLWLTKRKEVYDWRVSCRREFFPDLSDRELFDKIDWLREQDEWSEMQTKIQRGLDRIESKYQTDLLELLGERMKSLQSLHSIFLRDNLPEEGTNLYFI